MVNIKVAYPQENTAFAQRLIDDLESEGWQVGSSRPIQADEVLVAVLPDGAARQSPVYDAIYQANDKSRPVILVADKPTTQVPSLLAHLPVIEMKRGDDFARVRAAVIAAQGAGVPQRLRTPHTRMHNRNMGLILSGLVLFMFIVGVLAVGGADVQAPQREYNAVETEFAATRDAIMRPELDQYARALPRTTEEAANYAPTLRAVPTRYRPFMAMTATAVAGESGG